MLWDKDTETRLVTMWNQEGLSASDIASRLGKNLTRNSVIAKVFRMRNAGAHMRGRPMLLRNKKRRTTKSRHVRTPRATSAPPRARTRLELAMQAVPFTATPDTLTPTVFSVAELEPQHCRWVHGAVGEPGFGFCGRESFMGLSYCANHSRLVYQDPVVRTLDHLVPTTAKVKPSEMENA